MFCFIFTHLYIFKYLTLPLSLSMCVCICPHTHTNTYTYIQIYIYMCIHVNLCISTNPPLDSHNFVFQSPSIIFNLILPPQHFHKTNPLFLCLFTTNIHKNWNHQKSAITAMAFGSAKMHVCVTTTTTTSTLVSNKLISLVALKTFALQPQTLYLLEKLFLCNITMQRCNLWTWAQPSRARLGIPSNLGVNNDH